ncbi:MAG: hypothetical protein O3B43_05715 [Chloroflexi bacterium]|nr:hypothetical protein [Chloroflexota bacterium]
MPRILHDKVAYCLDGLANGDAVWLWRMLRILYDEEVLKKRAGSCLLFFYVAKSL